MSDKNNILTPEGIFNPTLRFAFTNITEEEFVSHWDGSPIKVPAGATIELPHHLAAKLTRELVNQIIMGNAKLDEVSKNKEGYRSPIGMSLGVPAARKVWEDQIVRQLDIDEESPQIQVMRAQIREELLKDLNAQPSHGSPAIPTSISEFGDLTAKEEVVEKKPIKVKTIKK